VVEAEVSVSYTPVSVSYTPISVSYTPVSVSYTPAKKTASGWPERRISLSVDDATTGLPGTLINGTNNKEYQPPASQNTGTTNIVKYYVRQISDEKCEFTYSNLLGKINDEWSVDYIKKTFYPAVKPGSVFFAMNTTEKYICYNSLPGTMYLIKSNFIPSI
jgi:hypothetical protein